MHLAHEALAAYEWFVNAVNGNIDTVPSPVIWGAAAGLATYSIVRPLHQKLDHIKRHLEGAQHMTGLARSPFVGGPPVPPPSPFNEGFLPKDTGRKAGRKGPHRESHEESLVLSLFHDSDQDAEKFIEWDGTNGVTAFGMDDNDKLGICGPAATDHRDVAAAGDVSLIGKLGAGKFDSLADLYFAYGKAMGEEGDQPDQGVDNRSWLGFLYEQEIIDGYGEVPLDKLDVYAPLFAGLITGQALDDDCEQDFESVPPIAWGSNDETPDPSEGHDTLLIKLHEDGSFETVTWAALQPCTLTYRRKNLTDAWGIFDAEDLKRIGATPEQVQAWKDALDAIHGTVRTQ